MQDDREKDDRKGRPYISIGYVNKLLIHVNLENPLSIR